MATHRIGQKVFEIFGTVVYSTNKSIFAELCFIIKKKKTILLTCEAEKLFNLNY